MVQPDQHQHAAQAFVTRMGNLRDAEAYLLQGLPLAVSLRFRAGELPGAPLSWSDGHLLVLTGFDAQGNPVVNDPAAPSDATVKRTSPRAVFERLWLGHAGGMAYVMAPGPERPGPAGGPPRAGSLAMLGEPPGGPLEACARSAGPGQLHRAPVRPGGGGTGAVRHSPCWYRR
ncbi:C39 family peptidase [Deinococcus planocerae]|uniref:C39 family peptidase n=1 Tax=Deinococcus planocerae TaxID=1737569 RepID=UPI003CCBC355